MSKRDFSIILIVAVAILIIVTIGGIWYHFVIIGGQPSQSNQMAASSTPFTASSSGSQQHTFTLSQNIITSGDTVVLSWSGANAAIGSYAGQNPLVVACGSVSVYDITNNQPFPCGYTNSGKGIATSGSDTMKITSNSGSPVQVTFTFNYGSSSLYQTLTVNSSVPPQRTRTIILAPAGGESLIPGQAYTIKWSAPGGLSGVSITLLQANTSSSYVGQIANNIPNSGSYAWSIPNGSASSGYEIYLTVPGYLPATSNNFSIGSSH